MNSNNSSELPTVVSVDTSSTAQDKSCAAIRPNNALKGWIVDCDDKLTSEMKILTLSDDDPSSRTKKTPATIISEKNLGSISKVGRFSLAAICALSLRNLFSYEWDNEFSVQSMRYIVANLLLPVEFKSRLIDLMKDDAVEPYKPYVDMLRSESFFQTQEEFKRILFSFITLAVHEGKYDSRWRVLIYHLAKLFGIQPHEVANCEKQFINYITEKTAESWEIEQKPAAPSKIAKFKRAAWVGLATVGGAALIGVTSGLAAPIVGAGLSSVLGSSVIFGAIGSTVGATIIGSLAGVAGGRLTGYKMLRRVGDIEEFEFHELDPSARGNVGSAGTLKSLHVTIVISGWICSENEENFTKPWESILSEQEQFYLKYESSYLLELGKAMEYIIASVASYATQKALKMTVLSGLLTAIAWPVRLLALGSIIDNPWGVCLRRSAQVGKQLAEVLLSRSHGHRPVTLIGYSLGARVIFYCLQEMAARDNCEGIIQDAILIGGPCSSDTNEWAKFRRVVAGRIVNGYCRSDWLLRFLYRTLTIGGVAGLQEIELNDPKIFNVDLTDLVTRHSDYPDKMAVILSHVGVAEAL